MMNDSVCNLEVYTSSLEKIDVSSAISQNRFLLSGSYGDVFHWKDGKVIKFLRTPGDSSQYELVSRIQRMNLAGFYHIYDVLSNEKVGVRTYAGTISKYYPEEKVNVWTMPSGFLLRAVQQLFASAKILDENYIHINDVHPGNVILNSSGITIIDVDDYYYYSPDDIPFDNCEELLYDLFCPLISRQLSYCFPDERVCERLRSELRPLLHEENPFSLLFSYDKPIDWALSKVR